MAWSFCEACFKPGLMLCSSSSSTNSSSSSKHQKGLHSKNLLIHPNNLILMGMKPMLLALRPPSLLFSLCYLLLHKL